MTTMVFTEAERARAREIRAYAEKPENVRVPDERCEVEVNGGFFAGVRAAFSITRAHGRRWRMLSASSSELGEVPERKHVRAIAVDLFGFDPDGVLQEIYDPFAPFVVGFAQPLELPYVMCRTDGQWIVYDPELPPGQRTALGKTFGTLEEAEQLARMLLGAERSAERPS